MVNKKGRIDRKVCDISVRFIEENDIYKCSFPFFQEQV